MAKFYSHQQISFEEVLEEILKSPIQQEVEKRNLVTLKNQFLAIWSFTWTKVKKIGEKEI